MASRDLVHRISVLNSIPQTTVSTNTTTNGSSVDTLGYESITMLAAVLAYTAGGTHGFKVQSSSDGATNWTDLASASVQTVGGVTTGALPTAGFAAAYNQVIGGVNGVSLAAIGQVLLGVSDTTIVAGVAGAGSGRFVRAVDQNVSNTTSAVIAVWFILSHPRHSGSAV